MLKFERNHDHLNQERIYSSGLPMVNLCMKLKFTYSGLKDHQHPESIGHNL